MGKISGVKIISIYGPTAVGKSTISKALVDQYESEKITRISLDRYLQDKGDNITTIEYLQDPVDWKLLESHLGLPVGTRIQSPEFDFNNFKRISDNNGKETTITPVIIVDGAWPYKEADVFIKLTASSESRKKRLFDRHLNERKGIDKVWVDFAQEHWNALPGEHPNFQPTLVIDTEKPIEEIVEEINNYF
jgi:uridine kinase